MANRSPAKTIMRMVAMFWVLLLAQLAFLQPACAREPMKVPDTPMDRRILSRPAALLMAEPGGARPLSKPPVFSAFYVFGEKQVDGATWLEVAPNRDGTAPGWMEQDQTVAWLQTITMAFTNPADRVPVLFFQDKDRLQTFLQDEAMSTRAELIARAVHAGQPVADTGVIAAEPASFVSLTDQFYLLPILSHQQVRVNNRPRRMLEVASINLEAAEPPATPARPFRTGITFVVDNSTSMQPYIDRTRQAIRRILKELRGSDQAHDISFGLVGFRSNTDRVPGLDYDAREFFPLKPDFDEATFLAALDQMNASSVSSHAFDEDGLNGMLLAEKQDWSQFDGRYIVYISDAGMLVGEEQGSMAGTTPELLATRLQQDMGIATFALFLKTRAGRAYHDDAVAQLNQLTRFGNSGRSLVFPIEGGDLAAFGVSVDSLTKSLLANVHAQADQAQAQAPQACDAQAEPIRCAAIDAGHAMSLAWLGREGQAQAPSSYQTWAMDFALDDPSRRAMTPRVLLTRRQLNDLYVTLQAMVEAFEQSTDDDPRKFFSVLQSVMARIMRDPSTLPSLDSSQAARTAAVTEFDDLGALVSDYLYGLPYDSELISMTPDVWVDIGDTGRYEFIQRLKSQLNMYELYYADASNWVTLNPQADAGEQVYPIPLEMMP
ncbi:hypothetical protein PY32053_03280 [Paracoccus yeei]|uniref:VWFA domain-containing protein n=2 Tax=Paracoccus yeei TaxID=147645 RepID=A0A386UQ29_9RHOB|nr:hypothetical protein PY32053_03280 [Paracoccus yeei]